ncbi:hypothetical protein AA16663_2371 [Komagataeibacter rhaeticus DSM 16663]|nr:hypothetical protein AA16663_2371 [Komagataeibacter rhaeticus DSM 16663]
MRSRADKAQGTQPQYGNAQVSRRLTQGKHALEGKHVHRRLRVTCRAGWWGKVHDGPKVHHRRAASQSEYGAFLPTSGI